MPKQISPQQLSSFFRLLEQQAERWLILTPNKRLGRYVSDQYADYKKQSGSVSFATPSIYSLQGWFQQQWNSLSIQGLVSEVPLSGLQEQLIWQMIIENDEDASRLLNQSATAKLAQQASNLAIQWHINASELAQFDDLDVNAFLKWQSQFLAYCKEHHYVTAAQQLPIISELMGQERVVLPQRIVTIAFEEFSPHIQSLFDVLAAKGVGIEEWEINFQGSAEFQIDAQVNSYESIEQEVSAAACWAKTCLIERESGSEIESPQRIGIVVPNLTGLRHVVTRTFERVFEPQAILPEAKRHATGFNISSAIPLTECEPVNAALAILKLNFKKLPTEEMGMLLLSPYVGEFKELQRRSLADLALRELDYQVSFRQLKLSVARLSGKRSSKPGVVLCPDFYASCEAFERILKKQRIKQLLPSEWVPYFYEQLLAMGWPGTRPLDTLEYQQVTVFQETLETFSLLDDVIGNVSFAKAFSLLNKWLQSTNFQAQTTTSPIQVLGVLEAAGLWFDKLWVMNMDAETWPPAPSPNPFLPGALQAELEMPQSSAARELKYAEKITQRLLSAAETVVFSYSKSDKGKDLQISPLIAPYQSEAELSKPSSPPENALSWGAALLAASKTESMVDERATPIFDATKIRGGTRLLKDQAACPFKAFAVHRLKAEPMPVPELGLSPLERGNVLHNALEILWRGLGDQLTLLSLASSELEEKVSQTVNEALVAIKNRQIAGPRFVAIEKQRLSNQILRLLEIEKQRPPFVVKFNETARAMKIAGIDINIRYDRVDELADGSHLVLDYKTGKVDINAWGGHRPEEPQVPLYCLSDREHVSGAAFALVSASTVGFKGVGSEDHIAPGIIAADSLKRNDMPNDWQALLNFWDQTLSEIADSFLQGDARVDPKTSVTCAYCALQPVCRIKEVIANKNALAINMEVHIDE